jgi:uncharacterized protein
VVLADTHVRDGGSVVLADEAWDQVCAADVVLHAGDVTGRRFLDELRSVVPVHAVLGNNDGELRGLLPETLVLELSGVRLAMVHDSGPRTGRESRMRRRFPAADLVVFGHSHQPAWSEGHDGQLLLNPGSATQRRQSPHKTLAVLELADGGVRSATHLELDRA